MSSTEQARAAVQAARALLADAPAFARASSGDVVEILGCVAELTRAAEALRVRLAHEVEERSQGPVDEPLCLLLGARHPKEALGRAFGMRPGRALDLLVMARATSPSIGITGADIPAKCPAVAAGLATGDLSFVQAQAIVSTLDPAAARADVEQLAAAERALVGHATDPATPRPPEQLTMLARRAVALLDPDGVLPNDERQRAMRYLRIREWRIVAELQPARTRTAVLGMTGAAAPETDIGAGGPSRLAATEPTSLAVRLPDLPARGVELRHATTIAPDEPDSAGAVAPSVRRPRRHRQSSSLTEPRLRARLERHGRARQHPARADLLPTPRIVLRR